MVKCQNPPRRELLVPPEGPLNLPGKPMHIYHELDGKIKNLKLPFSNQYINLMALCGKLPPVHVSASDFTVQYTSSIYIDILPCSLN